MREKIIKGKNFKKMVKIYIQHYNILYFTHSLIICKKHSTFISKNMSLRFKFQLQPQFKKKI